MHAPTLALPSSSFRPTRPRPRAAARHTCRMRRTAHRNSMSVTYIYGRAPRQYCKRVAATEIHACMKQSKPRTSACGECVLLAQCWGSVSTATCRCWSVPELKGSCRALLGPLRQSNWEQSCIPGGAQVVRVPLVSHKHIFPGLAVHCHHEGGLRVECPGPVRACAARSRVAKSLPLSKNISGKSAGLRHATRSDRHLP